MKIKHFVIVFLYLQMLSLPVNAAEEINIESDAPEPELSESTPSMEDEETPEPSEDSFIPSTQISEDLSVSFPVDI